MGIINWGFWKRKDDPVEIAAKPAEIDHAALQSVFDPNFKKHIPKPPEVILSDYDRVHKYGADGGHIVDLTNNPRKQNDGFAPDHELLTPYNRAHQGTRDGINSLMRR
jgi:hypothetical protein